MYSTPVDTSATYYTAVALTRMLDDPEPELGVMYEYLAYTCTSADDLRATLDGAHIDEELLTSVGELILALITGSPVQDIDDYLDAGPC